jgi:predicted HicB family RNase H-like nuclease|tara:strand:- start:691 stop:1077 length:387 start_codon:yes stop_codon:yes gene_type:complete
MKVDKLVKIYIKMRDRRSELKTAFEKEDERIKDGMRVIENELLEVCKETGAESLRTDFGTVTRRVTKRYHTVDWESMYQFIKDNNVLELLEKRIAQSNMSTFLQENPDKLPPGLNVDSRYAITVRRKT